MAKIINAAKIADGAQRTDTPKKTIAAGYEHLHDCDITKDLIFAEVDNEPVGYSRVW